MYMYMYMYMLSCSYMKTVAEVTGTVRQPLCQMEVLLIGQSIETLRATHPRSELKRCL